MTKNSYIDVNKDTWHIEESKNLAPYAFQYEYLPNEWFKKTVKLITIESLNIDKNSVSTISRYNSGLKVFFQFICEAGIALNTFADITPMIIEEYLHYLLIRYQKSSTRAVKIASLKFYLRHGMILGWSDFPINDLFDGTEYRLLQTEDSLKSMVIDDTTMNEIEIGLKGMQSKSMSIENTLIWCLVTIIKATGMRLHEALSIQENHLSKDLMGKAILEVINNKTKTDRYIPVNHEVVRAIRKLSKATEKIREVLKTDNLFVKPSKSGYYDQYTARTDLKKFLHTYVYKDSEDYKDNPVGVNFHQFRHTIGTELLNNGMSMREVMEYLGHNSAHSTRLYAKIQNSRFDRVYRKLGFIGVIEQSMEDIVDKEEVNITKEQRLMAQLPDGVCARPIKEQVFNCKKPNACLFCPKFITTPEFLEFHKDHLERIRADKQRYIEENMIGTDYLLFETEKTLEEIISKLER